MLFRSPPKDDGTERKALGPHRVVNQILQRLLDKHILDVNEFDALLELAPRHGVYLNGHTFEVDLFHSGVHDAFADAMRHLTRTKAPRRERMKAWASKPDTLDAEQFLKDIEAVGKGRFAQRLASIIHESAIEACPAYILDGVKYVASKCEHS